MDMQVLLSLGFRPFFLLAALQAALWVPLWLLLLHGQVPIASPLGPAGWHGHEMIFGYTMAVVAGFLLTAVRNWTQRPTAHGGHLAALAILWLAGRVVMLLGVACPAWLAAPVDVAFAPALALFIARPLLAARSTRNYAFIPLLLLLALANLASHLEAAGIWIGAAAPARRIAVDLVLVLIAIVGGRIIPLFTKNATGRAVRERGAIDLLALGSLAALPLWRLLATATGWPSLFGIGAIIAALTVSWRARGWALGAALRVPMLAILHVGHLLIPLGLLLGAASSFGAPIAETVGLHVLTYGAIGALTLGMLSRVALGHSGRPLVLHPLMVVGYGALLLGLLVRVLPQLLLPTLYLRALWLAGGLWSLAFLLYLVLYLRILVTPRADGKPD